ncbi:zeta toxin family protein [Microbacterium sp. kSW2-24]|uniref:AAA family ATPase n=1 Tax=Microbacterium galbinum TaxID=2851646 RepID=UPI001FFCC1F4|nr:AAA family ATPase [Microbacterium galbinum]MCK2021474.1 zeta toxin family protein [Microbacterium galbinum]
MPDKSGGLARFGTATTRLVVLRGDSASGKTTTALALRRQLGGRTALIHQDYFRRELLSDADRGSVSADAAPLIYAVARESIDLGYDVILEGVLNLRDYDSMLDRLRRDHPGVTRFYQFDVGFEETVRRHETRALRSAFGAGQMREWYDGWAPLTGIDEERVGPHESPDDIVARVLCDLREA